MDHKFSISFNAKNGLWGASYLGVSKFDPVIGFELDFKSEDQAKAYCKKFAYMKEKEMTGSVENTFIVSIGKTDTVNPPAAQPDVAAQPTATAEAPVV